MAAVVPREGDIQIWDITTITEPSPASERVQILKEPILTIKTPETTKGVTFSPNGSQLAAAGQEGVATTWDIANGEQLTTFKKIFGDC